MRLNVGCGNHYADGWTNVDIDSTDDVRPDVVADVTAGLPFPDGIAERVYLGHVLEHVDAGAVAGVLAECRRVLADGGELVVVGPDCDRADEMLAAGEITEDDHRLIVEGAGRWAHDVHLWRSTAKVVDMAMHVADFDAVVAPSFVALELNGWPLVSAVGWQFALSAVKS